MKVAPWFSPLLFAVTVPWWASARWRTMAKPNPRPPCFLIVELSACLKIVNSCGRASASMPTP